MNGAYYVFDMVGRQYGLGKTLLYVWAWTSVFYNAALLAVLLDAMTRMLISDTGDKYMPKFLQKKDKNGLPINGYVLTVSLSAFIMLLGIFLPDMNDIFNWLLNLNGIISPGVTCWIFFSFMQIRKNSQKFTSDYVFIKNDKLGYLAGLFLLIVTAAATILGIAPQDIKKFSGYWWYELIINIVAIIVLIGLGAILPSIRRREEEYGIAFNKKQWTTIFVLIIGSIIFDLYLGEKNTLFHNAAINFGQIKIGVNIVMIITETILAILICWLVGRRRPTQVSD